MREEIYILTKCALSWNFLFKLSLLRGDIIIEDRFPLS